MQRCTAPPRISHRYAFNDFEQAFVTAARTEEAAKVLVTFA